MNRTEPAPRPVALPGARFPRWRSVALLSIALGAFSVVRPGAGAVAATITTGTTPKDTAIRSDGLVSYVLNTGNSTLSVINVATSTVINTISLFQPVNTCADIDWHPATARVLVGCSNGNILSVDPVTGTVLVNAVNLACNFDVICADTLTPGVTAWAMDRNTNRLYRIAGGVAIPTVLLGLTGGATEIVEKRRDPAVPAALDSYLYALGSSAGQSRVTAFNRTTGLAVASTALGAPPSTPTGISTSKGTHAYVSLNFVGAAGRLFDINLAPLGFVFTPIANYGGAPALDVSVSGSFVSVAVNATAGGTDIYTYDIGDPAAIFATGSAPFSTLASVAGLSTWIGASGTIDRIMCVLPDVGTSATCVGLNDLRSLWLDPVTFGPTGYIEPTFTTSAIGMRVQEITCCLPCPPFGYTTSSGIVSNDSPSVAKDGGVTPVGDPPCGGGGGGTRSTGEGGTFIDLPSTCGIKMGLTIRGRREFDGGYGQGAFLSLDERLITQPSGDETFYSGMGRIDTYVQSGGGYQAPLTFDTTLVVTGTQKTVTDRFGTVSTFALTGERTSVVDWRGATTTYTYSGGKLMTVTNHFGRQINLSYAPGAYVRLSAISDCCGKTYTFRYDYLNRLRAITSPTSVDFPSGRTTWLSYMPNATDTRVRNNLVEQWSPNGDVVLTLAYDPDDRVISETLGTAQTTLAYATSTTTVTDLDGNTTEYTYNSDANIVGKKVFTKGLRVGEPASYDSNYAYNANGFAETIVYPRGNRTDITYNSTFDVVERRHRIANTATNAASDIVHAYTFGAFHQPITYTNPMGNLTAMVLDLAGNTIEVDHPTVTNPATQVIKDFYGYDSIGRLTSAIDGEGRAISFTYYSSGPMTGWLEKMVRDPGGLNLTTSFGYTSCGNIGTMTDPNGNVTTFTIDGEGYVTEITAPSPLSYRIRFTYDANRNVIKSETENIDRKGVIDGTTPWIDTAMTYDALNRMVSRQVRLTSLTTATTSYEYSGGGRLTKIISPEGNQTTLEWDERGLLFKATRGFGTADASTVQFDYDENGNRARVVDGRGNATTMDFDLHDRIQKLTNALGHYATYAYDLASNVLSVSRYDVSTALVAERNRYFDELNRLWKTVDLRFQPGSSVTYPQTVYTRDMGHLLTNVLNPLGNSTGFTYDDARRLLTETDAMSNVRALDYDDNSNVIRVSRTEVPTVGSSETFVTEFGFDELNRMIVRREVDRLNALNVLTTTYEYDSRANLTFRTDAEGHPTRWTYDLGSRLLERERALSLVGAVIDNFATKIVEQFAYDRDNRLTSLTDDNFQSTSYAFDSLDRATTTTYADTKSTSTTFDKNGNVTGWTDQNGTVVANTLDALDRLTARSIARGTGVLGTTAETYTYDALDRLLTAVDDDYQSERTWDSLGNLVRDKQGYNISGNERWKQVDTAWDLDNNQTSISYPSGFVVGHQRDAINRMTSLDDVGASAAIATFTWQASGRRATTTNQNGTSTAFVYDGFARVATIDHQLPSGAGSLHRFEYLYDNVHSRRMEKNLFDATWVTTLPSAVQTLLNGRAGKGDVFSYDWANRLAEARYDVANPATEVASPGSQAYAKFVAYVLDGLGNRSQVTTTMPGPTSTTVTYAADVVNQYTSVGSVSRTHNDNGNLSNDGTHKFAYDYENRIVEARDSTTNAVIVTYAFDALGRRIEKDITGGATTRFVINGFEIVEEYDGTNAWAASYTFEDGIDTPRTMDRADVADVDGDSNTTEIFRFHFHQQALGSVTDLTGPGGVVVERVAYDVYGAASVFDQTGNPLPASAVGNPFLFTGREWDVEIGLYYYRARAYDPGTGRFVQRDPLEYVDGLSTYEYGLSDPATLVDPYGLEPGTPPKPEVVKYPKANPKDASGNDRKPEDVAAENKRNAEEALKKLGKNPNLARKIGIPLKDKKGVIYGYSKGVTIYSIGVQRLGWQGDWCRYKAVWFLIPLQIVPDDGSVDAHEMDHIGTTQEAIDAFNAHEEEFAKKSEEDKRKDPGAPTHNSDKAKDDPKDTSEQEKDRKAEGDKLRDDAKARNDKLDDDTKHGSEAKKEGGSAK